MIVKVFWPHDLDIAIQEQLYGWKVADDWLVIAGALSEVRCFEPTRFDGN